MKVYEDKKIMKKFLYALPMFLLPFVSSAEVISTTGINAVITDITGIINRIVPLLIGIAVLVFLWGVLKYVISGADDADKRKEARGFMIWGIVSIFIMVSVWGLVGILQRTFNVTDGPTNIFTLPTR